MTTSRLSVFSTLRLIAVLTLVLPTLIFSYATWQNHKETDAQANERIEHALDVLQEHAQKALQTVERAISETNEVLAGMSDDAIRTAESDFYLRLKRTQQALPHIQSIWAFDAQGQPLASSTVLPVPKDLNNSDRSYFRAHAEGRQDTFISEVVQAKVGSLRFFVVSAPREGEQAGRFNGVIGVTVMPEHFSDFYGKLSRGRDIFALMRGNGHILARYPETGFEGMPYKAFPDAIRHSPESGGFTATSAVDGQERRVGYRRVPGFDVYVVSGMDTAAITGEFRRKTLTLFLLAAPAVLCMFLLTAYALYRARRFQEEAARREAAEAALKQAQRLEALGQLTGGVAHDFNNLLMVVSGNVQRLKKQIAKDGSSKRSFEAIETAVKRGTELTRHLLSFSRRQTHEAKVIDLGRALPVLQEMLQASLRGDISVETELPPDLWRVKVDQSEFELALLNLAVNARDAMPSGGRFVINARNLVLQRGHPAGVEGEFVAISAADTGLGIRPEILSRVFEPFFTTKEVGKGTGLGLSQVYGFARQAGGGATVHSELGNGTRVTLYLPRSLEDAAPDAETATHSSANRRERGRILVVEDNLDVADVTRGLLQDLGFEVIVAADVTSALKALKTNKPVDVVLSDIVMPGGANGLDLARLVRTERPDMPIILATGFSESAQAAADEGFTILRKPYEVGDLRDALAGALRNRRAAGA